MTDNKKQKNKRKGDQTELVSDDSQPLAGTETDPNAKPKRSRKKRDSLTAFEAAESGQGPVFFPQKKRH